MPKFPYTNPEARQEMIDSMKEQALNNIYEDPDRIEKLIEENSDIIQDMLFHAGVYKNDGNNIRNNYLGGRMVVDLILRKIDYLADEDVEHQI